MPARIPLPFGPDAHTLNVDKVDPTKIVAHPEGAPNPKGVEVAQGFGGSFSHNDTESGGVFHYAVDFLLPFGEAVLSQGNGKVIALDESRPDGGSYATDLSDSSMGPSGIGTLEQQQET